MDKISGFIAPVLIFGLILCLNAVLPGKWVIGYIKNPGTDERMKYHLNGIYVFLVAILLWFILGYSGIVSFDFLYNYRWYSLAGAFTTGVLFSLVAVLSFPKVRESLAADLFLGRKENIQILNGRIDLKMWLYLTGAIMLELNVLSFAAHHLISYGQLASPGIYVCAALITYFVVDYLIFEEVHLYTYDIFAERIGFKLGWGCLVFYSYFYAIAMWSTAALPDPGTPVWLLIIYVIIFLSGWTLARGSNMQKYYFKSHPDKPFLGIVPEVITDGKNSLLVNGFWGISRHVNYAGEILMATGIVLCAGYPGIIWPWLYPLYYVLLLSARQRDDDKRCALKYGNLWSEYVKKVRYRIIPYLY